MGTLGCIHDMMRRNKENRELRQRNRERMKLEEIKKQTQEKEQTDQNRAFRIKLIIGVVILVLLLLCGFLL